MSKNTLIFQLENAIKGKNRTQIEGITKTLTPEIFVSELKRSASTLLNAIIVQELIGYFPGQLIQAIPAEVLVRPNKHRLTPLELIIKTNSLEHFATPLSNLTTEMLVPLVSLAITRGYFQDLPGHLVTKEVLLTQDVWKDYPVLNLLINNNQFQPYQEKIFIEDLLDTTQREFRLLKLLVRCDQLKYCTKATECLTRDMLLTPDWRGCYPVLELLLEHNQLQHFPQAKEEWFTKEVISLKEQNSHPIFDLLVKFGQLQNFIKVTDLLDILPTAGPGLWKYILKTCDIHQLSSHLPTDSVSLLAPISRGEVTRLELIAEAGLIQHVKPVLDSINMEMLLSEGNELGKMLLTYALRSKCFEILRDKITISTEELLTTNQKGSYPIVSAIIKSGLYEHFRETFNNVTWEMLLKEHPYKSFLSTIIWGESITINEPTLFMFACTLKYIEYFPKALEGLTPAALITPTSEYGKTPLEMIVRYNRLKSFETLINCIDVAVLFCNDPHGNMNLKHVLNQNCFKVLRKVMVQAVDRDVIAMKVTTDGQTVLETIINNNLYNFLADLLPLEELPTFRDVKDNTLLHHIAKNKHCTFRLPQDLLELFTPHMLLTQNLDKESPLSIIISQKEISYLPQGVIELISAEMVNPHVNTLTWSIEDIQSVFSNFKGIDIIKILNINTNSNAVIAVLENCYGLIPQHIPYDQLPSIPLDKLAVFYHPSIVLGIDSQSLEKVSCVFVPKFFALFVCKDFASSFYINDDIFAEISRHIKVTDLFLFPMVAPLEQTESTVEFLGDSGTDSL